MNISRESEEEASLCEKNWYERFNNKLQLLVWKNEIIFGFIIRKCILNLTKKY